MTLGRARWREPRILVAAVVAVVFLSLGAGLAWIGRDDGGTGEVEPIPELPMPSVNAGGIEVPAPEGWTAVPLPSLGFGLAVPPAWEATVLAEDVLQGLERSEPSVPHFMDNAYAAAGVGAVFYAAGADDEGRVTDLKVRAVPDSGVEDTAGLLDYGRTLAADSGLVEPVVEAVEGAERPTVRISFGAGDALESGEQVSAAGTETLVLGPRGLVLSLIVTSEVPDRHDEVAPGIIDTLTFAG